MEQNNKKTMLLGLSMAITIICYGLCIYFSLWALFGELAPLGFIMIVGWLPCLGLVVLTAIVYVYALYCRKKSMKEAKKMEKAAWLMGILTNIYILVVSVIFVGTNFAALSRYLAVSIPSALNLLSLLIGARILNKKNKV